MHGNLSLIKMENKLHIVPFTKTFNCINGKYLHWDQEVCCGS